MKITLLLSLLTFGLVPVASKLRSHHVQRNLQDRTTIQSFFDIDYLTNGTVITNFTLVTQALVEAYNDLIQQGYSDPYNRSMDTAEVVDTTTTSGQSPNSNLNAFLRVTGSCNGCPSDSKFTLDARRRNLNDSKKKKSKVGSAGKGGNDKGSKAAKSKKSKGNSHEHTDDHHSHQAPMLLTEEELRVAYAAAVQRLQIGILDVVRLDEVDSLPEEPTYLGSSDEPTGQGGSSYEGNVNCPAVGGTFTGNFTSYFTVTFEVVQDNSDDVPAAVAGLATAYNRLIQRFEANITMFEASLYDPATGRRLSFEEAAHLQRKLAQRFVNIRAYGGCTKCKNGFTISNQVSRRKLSAWGQCRLPGLPTENELNAEYNVEIDRLNLPNVLESLQLDEMAQPIIPEAQPTPQPSTGKSNKAGKGDKNGKDTKSAKAAKNSKAKRRRR